MVMNAGEWARNTGSKLTISHPEESPHALSIGEELSVKLVNIASDMIARSEWKHETTLSNRETPKSNNFAMTAMIMQSCQPSVPRGQRNNIGRVLDTWTNSFAASAPTGCRFLSISNFDLNFSPSLRL